MRRFDIVGLHLRKKVRTTVPAADAVPVPDLIQRDLTASAPNKKYVGDITYLPAGDGQFLYLATVSDLHSKRLAGRSMADHMRTELVTDALKAAAGARGGILRGAIFHSDNGAQPSSRGRRNTSIVEEVVVAQGRARAAIQAGRPPIRSPGRPQSIGGTSGSGSGG